MGILPSYRIRFKITFLLFALLLIFSERTNGQITSVQDGSWLSPFTWDCTCIPGTTDVVTINHVVLMTMDWGLDAGGSITVSAGATFKENAAGRIFAQFGGDFINNGTVDISNYVVTGGQTTNNDSMHIDLALYITATGIFVNNGKIQEVDSLWNDAVLSNNDPLSEITAGFFYNTDSIYNNGSIGCLEALNDGGSIDNEGVFISVLFYNDGYLENYNGSSFSTGDLWNNDQFINATGSYTSIGRDFANGDTIVPISGPYLYNDGFIGVGRNFYNADVIGGVSGQLCIGEYSGNWGLIQGTSDICDFSGSTFDANVGTIDPGVTFCTGTCKMVVSFDDTEPTCSGGSDGSIIINVYGGAPPYSYLWNNGSTSSSIGGLTEGAYFVLVSDSIDSAYVLVNLNTPSLLAFATTTKSFCELPNGTATVTVSQGSQPYTYLWNDANAQTNAIAIDLNQGAYSVVITDGDGCTITENATVVSGSTALSFSHSKTFATCENTMDGSIDITASGGTAPYNYTWSPDVSNGAVAIGLEAGSYDVTVEDSAGCVSSSTIVLPAAGGPDCSPEWQIFNGITPNGDGIDDMWVIKGLGQYDKVKVEIFTNRGVVVWESAQYENDWGGTDQDGNLLMQGIYYYVVTRPEKVNRGWVHVSR